jgi:hypothetical protein
VYSCDYQCSQHLVFPKHVPPRLHSADTSCFAPAAVALLQLPLAVVAVLLFGFAGLGGDIGLWSLAVSHFIALIRDAKYGTGCSRQGL